MLYTTKKSTKRAARTLQAALVLAAAFTGTEAMAGVIVEHIPPNPITGGEYYYGQSVKTPTTGEGPWNNIQFNYYGWDNDWNTIPLAFGTLYLLDREYLGTPYDLSSASGLLATATTTDNQYWKFESGVTLAEGTKYWFYTDSSGKAKLNNASSRPWEQYADGDLYKSDGDPTYPIVFRSEVNTDMVFTLQTDSGGGASVPEPASLTLCGVLSLAGLAFARRRRKAAQPAA